MRSRRTPRPVLSLIALTALAVGAVATPAAASAAPPARTVAVAAAGRPMPMQLETLCQMAPRLPFICYRPR